MNPDYALWLLKDVKETLEDKIEGMNFLEKQGERIKESERTKYKHRVASLNFAIEILEEFQDKDE